jgi:hypothetical protein
MVFLAESIDGASSEEARDYKSASVEEIRQEERC